MSWVIGSLAILGECIKFLKILFLQPGSLNNNSRAFMGLAIMIYEPLYVMFYKYMYGECICDFWGIYSLLAFVIKDYSTHACWIQDD